MSRPNRVALVSPIACLAVLSMTLVSSSTPAAQKGADAAAHKQWMNDASDAQEDFRFALTDKDQNAAVDALVKLEGFMAQTEEYWTAKKAADGVKLAQSARALAHDAQTAVKAKDMTKANDAFAKMGAACNACHDLHLEKK